MYRTALFIWDNMYVPFYSLHITFVLNLLLFIYSTTVVVEIACRLIVIDHCVVCCSLFVNKV